MTGQTQTAAVPDGWPPVYVDDDGTTHPWDDTVPIGPHEYDDGGPPMTYAQLAVEIAEAQPGGMEVFLHQQWARQGSEPGEDWDEE